MSGPRLFGEWLPKREMERLLALGKSLRPPVPTTPGQLLELILRIATDRLVGRRLTLRTGNIDVSFTPVEISSNLRTLDLATGALSELRVTANHVRWQSTTLHQVQVACRDVRLRSLPAPYLVAGRVDLRITVTSTEVHHWVKQVAPDIDVAITDRGRIHARWARRPLLGHIELRATAGESVIYLDPVGIHLWQRSLPIAHRIRPFAVTVPDLPHGLQLTSIETGPGELIIHGVTDRARERLAMISLTEMLALITRLVDQITG
ncbi:LmeA family phospholipid-binding protein [Lolliginicoccus levis]|uniref:LmeA family phospholipid-binding protein n=1 Tax=Lolliginicoccus levis TaxID=2919542 RepID=UPI00241D90A1|nr:LmeA family phospholipid-binding protein [Lolliginicoccus levis]